MNHEKNGVGLSSNRTDEKSNDEGSGSVAIILASSSLVVFTWRVLQWRARKRARIAAARAMSMIGNGPLIDCSNSNATSTIAEAAVHRAKKWMSFQFSPEKMAKPLAGQVGGLSFGKKRLLTLPPDYVLKPVQDDDRGFREIAFYEAVHLASRYQKNGTKSIFSSPHHLLLFPNVLPPSDLSPLQNSSISLEMTNTVSRRNLAKAKEASALESFDAFAMWLAIFLGDSVVEESEQQVENAWKTVRKEMEMMRRLANFIPAYYGVICPDQVETSEQEPDHQRLTSDAYILLSDITINFSKPCVIDLKIGRQSFEPTATEQKKEHEVAKYAQQAEFGFRIVGMRIYDPSGPHSDSSGFRTFDKIYGRSLSHETAVLDAFRIFFRDTSDEETGDQLHRHPQQPDSETRASPASLQSRLRHRVISNVLAELLQLRHWFSENGSLAFYASSVLIVYEGDIDARHSSNRDVVNVKMIDFGHVRRQIGGDEGYAHGLATLSQMLKTLVQESAT